ncbi:NFX1-type zinc finger-containing protein 1-like, partial [Homalodisca vitripennis]|uniref:NFX1-type zinc finger-containing protein 1-like n=1 Tax=Homalodisca vitripennis TaxID=197043 RepID=UPI001EEB1C48
EPCTWACPHLKCSRPCSEICDRDICEQACSVFLNCGHICVGVCGELCPSLQDLPTLTNTQLSSIQKRKAQNDARYILVMPCEHPIELSSLRKWLTSNSEGEIVVKKCPKCSSIIENCQLMPEVKANKRTIDEIKAKDFGSLEEIAELRDCILTEMHAVPFHIFSTDQGCSNT